MRFVKAILALASVSLLLAPSLGFPGDSLTETRCWCANEDRIGLIYNVNFTSARYNHDYNYFASYSNRRQDDTKKNTLGVRCDNGTCYNIPKIEKYNLINSALNRFQENSRCHDFEDGRSVCVAAGYVWTDNERFSFGYKDKEVQSETVMDCSTMCKTKWRQDEKAYDLCTYENRREGEYYGKLIPSGQKMGKTGKLSDRNDGKYALWFVAGCDRRHVSPLKYGE